MHDYKRTCYPVKDDITANIAIHTRRAILLLSILALPQYLLCASSLAGPICAHRAAKFSLSYFMLVLVFIGFISFLHPC